MITIVLIFWGALALGAVLMAVGMMMLLSSARPPRSIGLRIAAIVCFILAAGAFWFARNVARAGHSPGG